MVASPSRADHVFRTLSVLSLVALAVLGVLLSDTRSEVQRIVKEGQSPCTEAPRGTECQDILARAIRGLDEKDACFIVGLGGLPCTSRGSGSAPGRGPATSGGSSADRVLEPTPPATPPAPDDPRGPIQPPGGGDPKDPDPPKPPPEPPAPGLLDPACEIAPRLCSTDLPLTLP